MQIQARNTHLNYPAQEYSKTNNLTKKKIERKERKEMRRIEKDQTHTHEDTEE